MTRLPPTLQKSSKKYLGYKQGHLRLVMSFVAIWLHFWGALILSIFIYSQWSLLITLRGKGFMTYTAANQHLYIRPMCHSHANNRPTWTSNTAKILSHLVIQELLTLSNCYLTLFQIA